MSVANQRHVSDVRSFVYFHSVFTPGGVSKRDVITWEGAWADSAWLYRPAMLSPRKMIKRLVERGQRRMALFRVGQQVAIAQPLGSGFACKWRCRFAEHCLYAARLRIEFHA